MISPWLLALIATQTASAYVASSPAQCRPGTHWTTSYVDRRGVPYRSSCRSNPSGYHLWLPRITNGSPAHWPNDTEHSKRWNTEEKERVLDAIGHIPEAIWPGHEIGIYRMDRSKDGPGNTASSNVNAITLYDSAFRANDTQLTRFIAHEFAHRFWLKLDDKLKRPYYVAGGWGVDGDNAENIKFSRGKNFIYADGDLGPEEDFANNIEAFLIEPKELERVSPAIHYWIHEVFGDNFRLR